MNEGPIRVGDLATWEGVRAPTMTRIVDGLVVDDDPEASRRFAERIHHESQRLGRLVEEVFTIESGLLTANGKLKRDLIAERLRTEIDAMYESAKNQASKNQAATTA